MVIKILLTPQKRVSCHWYLVIRNLNFVYQSNYTVAKIISYREKNISVILKYQPFKFELRQKSY